MPGQSHLLQMRGLKQFQVTLISINITSHLLQMRGLKRDYIIPATGARGRIFYRCVD